MWVITSKGREEVAGMDWKRDIVAGAAKAVHNTTLIAKVAQRICHILRRRHYVMPLRGDA